MSSRNIFGRAQPEQFGEDEAEKELLKKIDMTKALAGESFSFELDGPEAGFIEKNEAFMPKISSEVWDRMKLSPYVDPALESVLETMTGSFDEIEKLMEPIPGGIKKVVIHPGLDTAAQVLPGQVVQVHYIIGLEHCDEPVACTYNSKEEWEPVSFRVGRGNCLPLLDLAFPTMRIGEISKFLGGPEVAYGEMGVPFQGIPANSRAIVQIEVVNAFDKVEEGFLKVSEAEKEEMGFGEVYEKLIGLKNEGNKKFKEEEFSSAGIIYKKILNFLQDFQGKTQSERHALDELKMQILSNSSLSLYKQGHFQRAFKFGKDALQVEKADLPELRGKIYFRCAQALVKLQRHSEAQEYLQNAAKLVPRDVNVKQLQIEIDAQLRENCKEEKLLCQKMMHGVTLK